MGDLTVFAYRLYTNLSKVEGENPRLPPLNETPECVVFLLLHCLHNAEKM